MRLTFQAWWCGNCKTRNGRESSKCSCCSLPRFEKHAQVHTQDRAVIYVNPLTGEHRTPARADQAMPEIYARQGFERQEIMNMTAYERSTGVIHEASNFNEGNATVPFEPPPVGAPPEVMREIVDDMRAAIASGPWTGTEKLL